MNTVEHRQAPFRMNVVDVVLGIWALISPFVLGFSHNATALWNNVAAGIVVVFLGLAAPASRAARVLNILIGVWLLISPFALDLGQDAIFWNNLIVGFLILIAAISTSSTRHRDLPEGSLH